MSPHNVVQLLRGLRYVHEGKVHFRNYTSPGSYTLVFVFADGEVARPSSVAGDLFRVLRDARDLRGDWVIVGLDVLWEGEPEIDCITGEEIETSYGPVEGAESGES